MSIPYTYFTLLNPILISKFFISSSFVSSHLEHSKCLFPGATHVGSSVTSPSSQAWSNAGISSCPEIYLLHLVQYTPAVYPTSVHVGAISASCLSACPYAGSFSFFVSLHPSCVQWNVLSPSSKHVIKMVKKLINVQIVDMLKK